ncbi:MAG TPA: glycosyltransferase family 4 protein [Pirellulales bacterium]|jgi:UDP-glucose:(heptosyl)LPS alpha-1,3-glucosyltransferase
MKIGLVIRQFDPQRGGAERWTYQLAEHAVAAGHEVHVVAHSFAPTNARRLPIIPHPLPKGRSSLAFADAAQHVVRGLDLDLIHDMGFGWHFDILQPHFGSWRAQFERKLLPLPGWLRVAKRGLTRIAPRYQALDRLAWLQYADHRRLVLALSKLVARDLERVHGWPMERCKLIYNGVDLVRFTPENREEVRSAVRRRLNVEDGTQLVLFVAHNFALKGLATAIRAVGKLRQTNRPVRLLVLGSGRPGPYWRLARRVGAADAVQFLGKVEDSAPFYGAADVFALPTWYDSCSLSLLEALASGLPAITSSHNGAGELLTNGVDGFVLDDPGDWRSLAGHLETLADPQTHARVSAAGRRLAEGYPLAGNYQAVMELWAQTAGRVRRAA